MQLNRSLALLQGQSTVARKVYGVLPSGVSEDFSPIDIARELKSATGAGMDIHTMRGCLARLVESGLVREVVPGRFRRVETKEKLNVSAQRITTLELKNVAPIGAEFATKGEPMELIGGISARLRAEAHSLMKIADELDAGALAMAERAQKLGDEVAAVRQIATLLKGLG